VLLLGYSALLFFIIWLSQRAVRKHFGHKLSYRRYKAAKKRKAKAAAKKKTAKK
jgi:hypothetical protein